MLILVVALALPAYYRIGWSRMESHCSGEPPGKAEFAAVELSFTSRWFTCVYDDGAWTEASYWFGSHASTPRNLWHRHLQGGRAEVASFPGVAGWSRDAA